MFDVDSQRTLEEVEAINLLPALNFRPIKRQTNCSAASGAIPSK
ncbi:hypothetical protein ACNKHR_00645 [Shigella flexneri]